MPDLEDLLRTKRPRYSICTLVTDPAQYAEMSASFRAGGFIEPDCEFISADNTNDNRFDGYSGFNGFLSEANGDFVIVCHQDVALLTDGRTELDARITELTSRDPLWAVCGNAGRAIDGRNVIRITDALNGEARDGPFPSAVVGLDENFVVVRRRANIGVPPRLSGFHMYGTAICVAAAELGMNSYVIDFHLEHRGRGTLDQSYYDAQRRLVDFRSRRQRPQIVGATINAVFTSQFGTLNRVANRLLRSRLWRLVFRLFPPKVS